MDWMDEAQSGESQNSDTSIDQSRRIFILGECKLELPEPIIVVIVRFLVAIKY